MLSFPGRVLVLCGLVVSAAFNAGAGGKVETVDGTTLITVVVPFLPNPSDTSTISRAQIAVVRQFEKDFVEIFKRRYRAQYEADPAKYGRFDWNNVAVRLVPFTGLQVDGVESDLMSIAGGNPSDVIYVNFRKSDNYIRNGFLHPLDRPEDGYFSALPKEERERRIHPKLWPVIERKGPDGGKHVWALPMGGILGRILAYRKDLFDEAGLEYPNADWTWDDMLEAAKKMTDPPKGRFGLAVPGDVGWEFTSYLWSAGGEVMEYDEKNDSWRCVFGTRQAAEALDFFIQLKMEPWHTTEGKIARGYVNSDPGVSAEKWSRGEIAMNQVYIDEQFFTGLDPELVGLAPVPKGPHGERASEINSPMFGLFSEIKYPAVRDAAWEYILYQDSETAARLRTKIMVEGGLGRFLNPKQLERFGYPEIARLTPQGWADVFEIAIDTGRPEPYGRNSNLAYRLLARPLNEAAHLALQNALPTDREARLKVLENMLSAAEAKANELMIGKVSPEERTKRNIVAAIFLACVAATFGFILFRVLADFGKASAATSVRQASPRKTAFIFLLLAPALLSILLWKYYPLFVGSLMGFQDYRILGDSQWVGLKHFGDVLFDGLWWQSLWNSLRFSFLSLVFGFLPPVVLAILLQEVPRGKITYRLLFYLPAVLAGLVTLLLWKQFYDPSPNGVLNYFISRIPAAGFLVAGLLALWGGYVMLMRFRLHGQIFAGFLVLLIAVVFSISLGSIAWPILTHPGATLDNFVPRLFATLPEPVQWLGDPRYAMIACIIPGIWAGMGPGCLIYLAALKGIPEDYYEAADIDGATFLDKILTIVLPTMRPLLIINFVGAFIASWMGSSDTVLAMTGGQADTEVAPLSIFYKAFVYLEYGPATAMAWMLGFLLIGFTVYQLRMLARVEFKATGGDK